MQSDSPSILEYSRAQAIEDGVLVDVSERARQAGFVMPIAVAESVWTHYTEWDAKNTALQTYQDPNRRLWDILSMLQFEIRRISFRNALFFQLDVVPRDGKTKRAKCTRLKTNISAGDNGESVITLMLPDED